MSKATKQNYKFLNNIDTPKDDRISSYDSNTNLPDDNKDDLSRQATTLNLDNRDVRLTLWSMIYIVISAAIIYDATSGQIYYSRDYLSGYRSNFIDSYFNDQRGKEIESWYIWLIVATYIILWGALLLLSVLLCSCCICASGPSGQLIIAGLFVMGGLLQLAPLITGILYCIYCMTSDQ